MKSVRFWFLTGIPEPVFRNVRLVGSWDASGNYSDQWTTVPMRKETGEDGCRAFTAEVELNPAGDPVYRWGIVLDAPGEANTWGIPTEVNDAFSAERYRSFHLDLTTDDPQIERYHLTYGRRLGAHKVFTPDDPEPGIRFAVWAPNARRVDVVFGFPDSGYIDDEGNGIDPARPTFYLHPSGQGIWETDVVPGFVRYVGLPYMYRIERSGGDVAYRTDLFARSQIGTGGIDPARQSWPGTPHSLDGTKSCSVVVDPDRVLERLAVPGELPGETIPVTDFWKHEFTIGKPVPSRVEDLVIYELHVGALGCGEKRPGNLRDAIRFLDHLVDLGVNTIELLPMSEFSGSVSWGYGDTHHFVIETSAGGRDAYKHFVRECHRRGIAVIQDVVYNHFDHDAGRAQWAYDSDDPAENIYYWYEGLPTNYERPDGGYLNNGSSGYTPRFSEEVVRRLFVSSALFLIQEMHVDGLRVDLTQAIHRDNTLNADGRSVGTANLFGQKLLREWSRTLRLIHPDVILIAEDHTGWDALTRRPDEGGLGFDATWYASFYHHLVGDSDMSAGSARLIKEAGQGDDRPLAMDRFAGAFYTSRYNHVVYHESHDEAGNAGGSARTICTAVNGAPLWGDTRRVAEARCRVAFGLSFLSAGTPMFFMGEEVGAQKYYTYNNFFDLTAGIDNRENITGERFGDGALLFRFYQDLLSLGKQHRSIRTHQVDMLHVDNENRVIAFKRWRDDEELIVVASLNNQPFAQGYGIRKDPPAIPDGGWREVFNSDAAVYGGQNIGNAGAVCHSRDGQLDVVLPAIGFVVFARI